MTKTTNEEVEAAAEALWDREQTMPWGQARLDHRQPYRHVARAMLEAAEKVRVAAEKARAKAEADA